MNVPSSIKALLASPKARAVAVTFEHGVYGGLLAYAAGTQVDTTLLAHVAWWKGALVFGATAGLGSLVASYAKPLVPILRRLNAPPKPGSST